MTEPARRPQLDNLEKAEDGLRSNLHMHCVGETASPLDSHVFHGLNSAMTATLSPDGNILLPPELRDSAHLLPGDTLDVQIYKGTIVLRKHQPLTADQCAALLEQSRSQPGSGLGLSLAKAVMKFHGGRLELAAADPGLTVAMVFPESKVEP